ncbi:MAG TPA: hypothetical protein VKT81_14080 [Bryobacteraceae bacterium]|nr:hypothetical protein [Bryobacteraceae bacterium]
MIQLNTSTLFGKQDASNSLLPSSTESKDGNSFQKALTASLASNMSKFGIGANNATLPSAPLTTETTTATPAAVAPPVLSGSSTAPVSPFAAAASSVTPPVPSVPSGPDLPAPPTSNDPNGDSTMSFDDAYWAAQPAAVQQLRNIDDYGERSQLAAQLTAKGYNIDVPIMVYGWDPGKITAARESYGYTWVPSAMQKPVQEAPGISTPGGQLYDPNHAPSGSIAV